MDAIVNIIFGSVTVFLMLVALWQFHKYADGGPGTLKTGPCNIDLLWLILLAVNGAEVDG